MLNLQTIIHNSMVDHFQKNKIVIGNEIESLFNKLNPTKSNQLAVSWKVYPASLEVPPQKW